MSKLASGVLALVWMMPCLAANVQRPVTVLMAPTKHDLAPGETVTLKVFVRNNLTAAPPLVIDAAAKFTDDEGNEHVASTSLELYVSHPAHVDRIRLIVPCPLAYVPGSAAANGQRLTAVVEGQWVNVQLDADIPEQQTVLVTLDVVRPPL